MSKHNGEEAPPGGHLTATQLCGAFAGEVPAGSLLRVLLLHVCDICPRCASEFDLFASRLEGGGDARPAPGESPGTGAGYRRAMESALAAVEPHRRLSGAETPAEVLDRLQRLLALAPEERFARVALDPTLATPGLCTALLRLGRTAMAEAPREAEQLLHLVLALSQHLDAAVCPPGLVADLQAQAWALLGREKAAQGDGAGAALAAGLAECLLAAGSGDPVVDALVRHSRALALWLEGRRRESLLEADAAAALLRLAGEIGLEASVVLETGLLLAGAGCLEEAHGTLRAGLLLTLAGGDSSLAYEAHRALGRLRAVRGAGRGEGVQGATELPRLTGRA